MRSAFRLSIYREFSCSSLSLYYALFLWYIVSFSTTYHVFEYSISLFTESFPFYSTQNLAATNSLSKRAFICPNKCGSSYKHKNNLQAHMKHFCGVPKQFECTVCGKMFTRKDNMKTHLGIVHKILTKWFFYVFNVFLRYFSLVASSGLWCQSLWPFPIRLSFVFFLSIFYSLL